MGEDARPGWFVQLLHLLVASTLAWPCAKLAAQIWPATIAHRQSCRPPARCAGDGSSGLYFL